MRNKIVIAILLLVVGLSVKAQDMQNFVVKVGDFTHLSVVDHINVEYVCNPDSTGLAKFTAKPAMSNQIIFTNNNKGKLSVSIGSDSVYSEHLPTVTVYSTFLQHAENLGDSLLRVKTVASAPRIKFKLMNNGSLKVDNVEATTVEVEILTGHGSIEVAGKCTDLKVKNTGKAEVRAESLLAKNVNCRILGTGKVYCTINGGNLSINGSGTGKLYYHGTPSDIKSFQLGTIKAISLDKGEEEK